MIHSPMPCVSIPDSPLLDPFGPFLPISLKSRLKSDKNQYKYMYVSYLYISGSCVLSQNFAF